MQFEISAIRMTAAGEDAQEDPQRAMSRTGTVVPRDKYRRYTIEVSQGGDRQAAKGHLHEGKAALANKSHHFPGISVLNTRQVRRGLFPMGEGSRTPLPPGGAGDGP